MTWPIKTTFNKQRFEPNSWLFNENSGLSKNSLHHIHSPHNDDSKEIEPEIYFSALNRQKFEPNFWKYDGLKNTLETTNDNPLFTDSSVSRQHKLLERNNVLRHLLNTRKQLYNTFAQWPIRHRHRHEGVSFNDFSQLSTENNGQLNTILPYFTQKWPPSLINDVMPERSIFPNNLDSFDITDDEDNFYNILLPENTNNIRQSVFMDSYFDRSAGNFKKLLRPVNTSDAFSVLKMSRPFTAVCELTSIMTCWCNFNF